MLFRSFSRTRIAYTAGEAVGPDIIDYYRALGINMKQVYGMTETCVPSCVQPDGEVRPETVGKPLPGIEMRIADNGELMVRAPGVFAGYFKNDSATAETKTAEGWVHTGDAALFDKNGHLRIIDRDRKSTRLNSSH